MSISDSELTIEFINCLYQQSNALFDWNYIKQKHVSLGYCDLVPGVTPNGCIQINVVGFDINK